ncbi:MAG: bifunctional riboflavin kinase/FAD synthetase [Prevotellaceae bacterium]|jgi:riboflavin kinase/FMN adenylyltransferase|nr:bifunctional riboflavin kinase/FAD synthetase [Prevotellaceae bacterium]
MQYSIYPDISGARDFVATTGFFDGVHLGHKAVLDKVVKIARNEGKPSCAVTFWPHPRIVLQKDVDKLKFLSTLDEKQELIAAVGIDSLIVIPFTLELSHLTAEQFFTECLLHNLGISYLIVGYDHRFGRGGQANFTQIKRLGKQSGVPIERVVANSIGKITISSSKIRDALQSGDIALANQLLGYTYAVSGIVVHGKELGRKMGFPTANIQPHESLKLLPQDGTYAVEVILDDSNFIYKGMLSIGVRPTIDDNKQRAIEVNIFDFDKDIYGEAITVRFVARLRDELKFDSIEALRQQLFLDKINTLAVFK